MLSATQARYCVGLFGDWIDRIAKGELPHTKPTRPEGAERNVVVTPHIAAGTRDALVVKMRAVFANVERFYAGEPLANRVSLP